MDTAALASINKDIVIATFKSFAFRIFEVSKNEIITNVWAKDEVDERQGREKYLGLNASDINNDNVIRECVEAIRKVFSDSEPMFFEYNVQVEGHSMKFPIKVLRAIYNNDFVLVIVEKILTKEIIEDKWHLALNAVGDGIWDVNLETNRIFFSPKWWEIFGYSEDEIQTTEQWRAKIHPGDLEIATKMMADHLEGRTPVYTAELRYLCKDGSYRWILSRGLVTNYSQDNKPLRFIGTHNDIHERKLHDMANIEDKKRYKILFDYSVALICTHDLDGNVLNVNPYATELLKFNYDELVSKNIADLVPEKFRKDVINEYLPAIINNSRAEGILRMLAKDGTIKHLLYKNYLFSNPEGEKYIIAFAQDITERLRAESGLRTSEKLFSTYFNLSGIGMAIVNPSGKWERVNDALCRMIGYTPSELTQMNFGSITHPEDAARDIEAKERMLRGEIDIYEVEKRYITKEKKTIWISLTASLVKDSEGKPKFFLSQFADISTRKALTNELHTKNQELNQARDELLNKVKELEELSHAIGHNLRGPAKNINLLTKVLNVKCGKASDNEDANTLARSFSMDELASMIDTVGNSMTNSLETLLNIAEIRLNKEIPFDECNFDQVINSVLDQLAGDVLRKK
ncbi:PAS domain-containing protein [Niabella ginsengisoli]|uniref:histidine kinase n=1 Tax=Niabella ginsengisoli TaxID=522298 RepID=A0ABS9SFI9_9BACT|nr:PAS domain S-box protein [Niabella ginsengisoli]MCH5597127.1 PAS domain S-box protein [Niabella ginsengisoli]